MRLKIKAIIGAIMLSMIAGFYWYYQDSQKRIQTLAENNSKLESAIETSEQTIESLKTNYEESQKELRRVNRNFQEIRKQNSILSEKLQEHDLGILGSEKPGLVENIINRATEKSNRCFEILSGAELTEKEKNAESPKSANSECPWLFESDTSS